MCIKFVDIFGHEAAKKLTNACDVTLSRLQHLAIQPHPLVYYNDAIYIQHILFPLETFSLTMTSPKGQYTVITNLCTSTKKKSHACHFLLSVSDICHQPLCSLSFYLTTPSCRAKGSSTPTHTHSQA